MNELADLCVREMVDRLQEAVDRLRRELKDHRECLGMMICTLERLHHQDREAVELAIELAKRQFDKPNYDDAVRLGRLYERLTKGSN